MAEFVEKHLEELLPVFEHIQEIELLPETELTELIRECRRYEYQLAKKTKKPKDFMMYADYLADVIIHIERRRKEIRQKSHYEHIDKPLKYKCAFLHRLCSERFKKEEYFRKEIDYAKSANLLGVCSQAYTRFLQFHGHNPRIHEEAGIFEFFVNKSAENARVIFQMALRKFPTDIDLWASFFKMELGYVEYLKQRKDKLISPDVHERGVKRKADDRTEPIDDDTMLLKLVNIVRSQGLKSVPEKQRRELGLKFLEVAKTHCPLANNIVRALEEELQEHNIVLENTSNVNDQEGVEKEDERTLKFWEDLVDSAIESGSLAKVEKVFQKAFLRAPSLVSANLKAIRLNFLSEVNPDDPGVYRKSYNQMASALPSCLSLHYKLIELEEKQSKPDVKLVETAFENALIEFGRESVECWIKFLKFLLKTSPERVGPLNARARVNLSAHLTEELNEEWTKVLGGYIC